jgi:hypothetical protein
MVAAISYADGPLTLARRRLGDAVAALADPQPVSLGGVYRFATPVYLELRQSPERLQDLPHRCAPVLTSVPR